VGGKLTNVDTEVDHVGGELVTDNSLFNPHCPTCCSPRGPVIAFTLALFILPVGVSLVLVVGLCASVLYVWVHGNVFAKTQDSVRNIEIPQCSNDTI